jgi:hypothetical protein
MTRMRPGMSASLAAVVAELNRLISERGCANRLESPQSRMVAEILGPATTRIYAKYFLVMSVNILILLTKMTWDGWD